MTIHYRTGKDVNTSAVWALSDQIVYSKGRKIMDIEDALARSSHVVSAWDHDRLVGLARTLDDGHWYATIWDVMVDQAYQGQGIGKRIVELGLSPYRGKGYQFVALFAAQGRVDFYERLGFVVHPRGMVLAAEYRGTPIR